MESREEAHERVRAAIRQLGADSKLEAVDVESVVTDRSRPEEFKYATIYRAEAARAGHFAGQVIRQHRRGFEHVFLIQRVRRG